MPSYVFVWENNTLGHSKVKGHEWPGHASMNIGSDFYHEKMTDSPYYVSCWPTNGANFGFRSIFERAQQATYSYTFQADVSAEHCLPDHVIELPTIDMGDTENKMLAAWKSIKEVKTYKSLRKNCSTIVSRILHAGGFHAHKWAVNCNFVWSPSNVAKLAIQAGGKPLKWSEFLAVLRQSRIYPSDLAYSQARSGVYCSTGAPVKYQTEGYKEDLEIANAQQDLMMGMSML